MHDRLLSSIQRRTTGFVPPSIPNAPTRSTCEAPSLCATRTRLALHGRSPGGTGGGATRGSGSAASDVATEMLSGRTSYRKFHVARRNGTGAGFPCCVIRVAGQETRKGNPQLPGDVGWWRAHIWRTQWREVGVQLTLKLGRGRRGPENNQSPGRPITAASRATAVGGFHSELVAKLGYIRIGVDLSRTRN
jgi:hypothetical protein